MPERGWMHRPLQRSVFKWVLVADDEERAKNNFTTKPPKLHATSTVFDIARHYGVPEHILRHYVRHEIEEEESCRSLPFTMIMFLAYTAGVLWHSPDYLINAVEDSVTFDIEDNANYAFFQPVMGFKAIQDINSHVDFWSWMIQGFAPLMFAQERGFSEDIDTNSTAARPLNVPVPPRERGYLLHVNKMIGGVRVRQQRSKYTKCETPNILVPFYNRQCLTGPKETVGKFGGGYELYPEPNEAKITPDHDPAYEFYMWPTPDVQDNLDMLVLKEKQAWLDDRTLKIELTVPIYNGQYGIYSVVHVNFFFSRGGHIWKSLYPLSTYGRWLHGWWNILADAIWTLSLFSIFLTEAMNIWSTVRAKSGGGCSALYHDYLSFWIVVDWATVVGGLVIIGQFAFRWMASNDLNNRVIELGKLDRITQASVYRDKSKKTLFAMEEEVNAAYWFRICQGFYPLLIVLRLFKAFAHQPRLSIVTSTLGKAAQDFVHFFLVFMSIFATFAICGVVLFGREMEGYTTLPRSCITCFRTMMGDFDWDALREIGRPDAGFWFGSFMIIIVILMLNMLLAIVMDAYSERKEQLGEAETLWKEFMQAIERWKGENTGDLVPLREASRGVREIKEKGAFRKIRGRSSLEDLDKPTEGLGTLAKLKASTTGITGFSEGSPEYQHVEEYSLITIDALVDACPMMQEEQALDLIANAAYDWYLANRGENSAEEMCRSIRKVNASTKKFKRYLKKLMAEREALLSAHPDDKLSGVVDESMVVVDVPAGDHTLEIVQNRTQESMSFPDQLDMCRRDLRAALEWIGDTEMRDIDELKGKRPFSYPMQMQRVQHINDVAEFSVMKVIESEQSMKTACRQSGIGDEHDSLRVASLGKTVRVIRKDPSDNTIKCRVPGIGDLWFAPASLQCLQRLQDTPNKQRAVLLARQGSEDRMSWLSETSELASQTDEDFSQQGPQTELLRKINDLESEKRLGQQTVTEAINAVSELKWQQVKEKTDRAKLHQKIQGLKKKLISRHREHRRLAQEAGRQEERLNIVTKSRDEYAELAQNLTMEKQRLEDKLAQIKVPDGPTSYENGYQNGHNGYSNGQAKKASPRGNGDRRARGRDGNDRGSDRNGRQPEIHPELGYDDLPNFGGRERYTDERDRYANNDKRRY